VKVITIAEGRVPWARRVKPCSSAAWACGTSRATAASRDGSVGVMEVRRGHVERRPASGRSSSRQLEALARCRGSERVIPTGEHQIISEPTASGHGRGQMNRVIRAKRVPIRERGGLADEPIGDLQPNVALPVRVELAHEPSVLTSRQVSRTSTSSECPARLDVRDRRRRHGGCVADLLSH